MPQGAGWLCADPTALYDVLKENQPVTPTDDDAATAPSIVIASEAKQSIEQQK
jgi:hypothetical protein